jgi:DNA-binding NarL/FixJ family response regulator
VVRGVLVVDDNAFVRKALCELFAREEQFDVCGQAKDGQEAIEKAVELHPDLVVTDLLMPVMNGLDETRILKRVLPDVPVILYTAHRSPAVEKEACLAGASAVISKSEPPAALIAEARSFFDHNRCSHRESICSTPDCAA